MTPSDAARALSRLGASKGGHARAKALSSRRRKAIASAAGKASALVRRNKHSP